MPRRFNTAGPCKPEDHYTLFANSRIEEVKKLVEDKIYFTLHAPRQTGKTTCLYAMAKHLTESGEYVACVLSCEVGQAFKSDVDSAEKAMIGIWVEQIKDQLPKEQWPQAWIEEQTVLGQPGQRIQMALSSWAKTCPRPLVVFLDEIDALQDMTLISVLRQLRTGYLGRPKSFPASLGLIGLRDVRDYKIKVRESDDSLGTASPFNIKSESILLPNFTQAEVTSLYTQHTEETGQVFTKEASEHAFYLTQGQPWLVNALARQIVEKDVKDITHAITKDHVDSAKETLIQRRDTHLDSLIDKLREERVRRVIEPILVGNILNQDVMNDDLMYARDLGLVKLFPKVEIANPIYREVIPRSLNFMMQMNVQDETSWYLTPDGFLDMKAMLKAFQSFFAENSEVWLERFDYKEAGPHLLLMAFLQRVVNGGGKIMRESAVGTGRADLVIEWKEKRYVLELKIFKNAKTIPTGIEQLSKYLDRFGESEGYLIVFDRRSDKTWEEKVFEQEEIGPAPNQRKIFLFGM